jgi:hypothetical protein
MKIQMRLPYSEHPQPAAPSTMELATTLCWIAIVSALIAAL